MEIEKNQTLEASLNTEKFHNELQQHIQKEDQYKLSIFLEERYKQEGIDYSWAEEARTKILDIFLIEPELEDYSIAEADCRSSMCRIQVPVVDTNNAEQLNLSLGKVLGSYTEDGRSILYNY